MLNYRRPISQKDQVSIQLEIGSVLTARFCCLPFQKIINQAKNLDVGWI
jgi:hypothetical protein